MSKINQKSVMSIMLVGIFTLIFMLIIGRFMYIQITGEVQSVDLINFADKFRDSNSELEAERGEIFDKTGMVLAGNKPSYDLYAIVDEEYTGNSSKPLHVEDFQKTAAKLAHIIGLNEARIVEILEGGKFQVEFGRFGSNLTEEKKQEIESLELPGLYFDSGLQRYYPNGSFASHVLGFTEEKVNEETQKEEIVGAYGVEQEYNEQLKGENGYIRFKRDKYGYKLLNAEEQVQQPKDGNDIYLTIDQKIQTFLEDAMTTVDEKYEPEKIIGIVMDPDTGEVLAISNRPSFNPNTRENIQNWYNDAISYPFEPGSTMKIFTLSAAIEEGVYNGSDTYQSGRYRINENYRYISDYNDKGWGVITYDEGVRHSSNVAFAKILWEQLGPEKYLEYLHAFQFDQATGIDLKGEKIGTISYRYPMDQITTAFGQNSTFTPIQIMKAASVLANEGKMVKPFVTSHIKNPNNQEIVFENKTEYVGNPISPDTVEKVKDLLESTVVSEDGTGKKFRLENFSTFGKTGTAQMPNPEGGGYMDGADNLLYSFIGMAPKEDPELMMYVAVQRPKIDYSFYGSDTTSYIYKTVMENSLHYLEVEPDQDAEQTIKSTKLEDLYKQPTKQVVSRLKEQEFKVTVAGNGDQIVDSTPKEGDTVLRNKHIILQTNGEPTMPDVSDWTLREVLSLVELLEIKVDFLGKGFVIKQNIPVGSKLSNDSHLIVELKTKTEQQTDQNEEENSENQDTNQSSDE
ncbi:PASTA domain-containing protein [Filobacillus milosensis]|uniref:serine-type D-Ala-D-Ala carboxypeptidase n=1 Tax=Filobacillus milosensis TaxID=94137 RepID=A0A4Y8INZ5_9BACI|nr:penicillin-binding transpeptidase domain-containing protein [Filobacillus milosensis]TFB23303.1 PASTA domain-containing protein [Filobacillus milosensis]